MTEQEQIRILREALHFYANEDSWESCDDDGENGLHRKFITATCHPRTVAQNALQEIYGETNKGKNENQIIAN